jgi:hypothetical protein
LPWSIPLLVAPSGIAWFTSQVFTRTGLDQLPAHLEQEYGVAVSGVAELDVGVYRAVRADGPDWVARVFPAARPRSAAEGDAQVLKALAAGEMAVARTPLTDLRSNADPSDRAGFATLDEALATVAATTTGRPEAFVHPDFVPVNAIGGSDDLPPIVD